MNRKQEQAELMAKLGVLLGPVLKMAESGTYDSDERSRIIARFFNEVHDFDRGVIRFATGEKGHTYNAQMDRARNHISQIMNVLDADPNVTADYLKHHQSGIINAVLSIPVSIDSTIHEARTPFTTYCLVRNLCSTVGKQIVWLDRYFDQTIFHRYFTDTPATAQIILVTWPRSECKGKKDEQRYDEFIDVSKLFAQERGRRGYWLITSRNFHDRWLRCDDKLFTLGGSIKDIGKDATFTISKLDSTPENMKHFDDPIQTGTEVFGPNVAVHP